MSCFSRAIVHGALASHRGIAIEGIDDRQRLGADLAMDALDLALIGVRLEQVGAVCDDFPLDEIDAEMTVRELVELFQRWWRGEDREDREDLPPDTLRSSIAASEFDRESFA